MSITIRDFQAHDYPAVLDLYKRTAPPGMQPPLADAPNSQRCVAVEAQMEQVVGFGSVPLREMSSLELLVSPPWQRQGIGRLLWERLAQDLAGIHAIAVEPWVREENAPAIAWLQKQGFVPTKQEGPVSLFPQEADLSRFDVLVAEVAMQGIVLTTLARERQDEKDCLARLHTLYNRVNADVPGSEDYAVQSLEECIREQDEPEAMPDAYFIAKHGSHYIGLSYLRTRDADPNCVEPFNVQQLLTGVLPHYRRRGIAIALKVKTITYAREHGFRRIFTNSSNPAMQALNAKLGFQSGPWRVYLKTL
jgi:GNAT superfamily N-acetyltransferase